MESRSDDRLTSPLVRRSLARGLARDTIRRARESDADVTAVLKELRDLAPNPRSAARMTERLRRRRGVVRAGVVGDRKERVLAVMRNAPDAHFPDLGEEAFTEGALIYSRVEARANRGGVSYLVFRVTISPHAIQRLVERSACPLGDGLLPAIDLEVIPLFRGLRSSDAEIGEKIWVRSHDGQGLWLGCLGQMALDESWEVQSKDEGIPTLAVRTFLNEESMSPEIWLRWKGDPTLTVG